MSPFHEALGKMGIWQLLEELRRELAKMEPVAALREPQPLIVGLDWWLDSCLS